MKVSLEFNKNNDKIYHTTRKKQHQLEIKMPTPVNRRI